MTTKPKIRRADESLHEPRRPVLVSFENVKIPTDIALLIAPLSVGTRTIPYTRAFTLESREAWLTNSR